MTTVPPQTKRQWEQTAVINNGDMRQTYIKANVVTTAAVPVALEAAEATK